VIYNPDLDPNRAAASRIVRFLSDLVKDYYTMRSSLPR
jgi:hypothetical protein